MNYQEQLQELKKSIIKDNVEIKYVPGKSEDGWLSDDTRKELTNLFTNNPIFKNMGKDDAPKKQAVPPIQIFRDNMGGKT